jgi:tripartite-type tricarboxylate transporter receptor subunit TctC
MRSAPTLRAVVLAAALGTVATGAAAEGEPAFPTKPIHIVIGFAAGGGNDIIGRVIGQKLSEALGQPVIIDNKPGASGIIATEFAARSAPDGYTVLMGPSGAMSVNPAVYPKLGYAPLRDFVPISQIAAFPLILAVNPRLGLGSVGALIAYAKANPAKANYASSSTAFTLATELFKQRTGAPMEAINYKSSNESVLAVMSGEVLLTIADAPPVATQLPAGNVRGLAVTDAKRMTEFPAIPTMAEAGVTDMVVRLWTGFFVPAGTPAPIVKKLEAAVVHAVTQADVRERFKTLAVDPVGGSSADFGRLVEADIARWTAVAKTSNIKLEQ